MRLFPRLQAVWANTCYSDSDDWARQRLVCAEEHFDTYFRFEMSGQTVSLPEIQELIGKAEDREFVIDTLRDALQIKQGRGRTKASYILDELNRHRGKFPDEAVGPFLSHLFEVADDLPNPADEERGFGIANNHLRTHWLMRALTMERFDLPTRSSLLLDACQRAALGWLFDFELFAYRDHHPQEDEEPKPPENRLMTAEDTAALRVLALDRVRAAALSGELLKSGNLAHMLYSWRDMTEDDGVEVRSWTKDQLAEDASLPVFAGAFLGKSYSHGIGGFGGMADLVYREHDRAQTDTIDSIIDAEHFRDRLRLAINQAYYRDEELELMRRFLEAWERRDQGVD